MCCPARKDCLRMKDDRLIIKCPHCGAEYMPSEIFYPEDLLPNSEIVTKDDKGRIIAQAGSPMNLEEDFVCEYCNHAFTAKADFSFSSEKNEGHDFGFECSLPMYDRERVELKED